MICTPNPIFFKSSRRMNLAEHVARMGKKTRAYRFLMEKLEGRGPLGMPSRRWRIILKGVFKKWEGGMD
jgi:hypothetical protein